MKITVTVSVLDDQGVGTTLDEALIGSDWSADEIDDAAERCANVAAGLVHDAFSVLG